MYVKVGYNTHVYVQTCRLQTKDYYSPCWTVYSLKVNCLSHSCVVPVDDYDIRRYSLTLYVRILHYMHMSMPHTYICI